jgi:hypothetical protein
MMDKFRVGQKVRIIKAVHNPELLGVVCVITEEKRERTSFIDGHKWQGYGVDIDVIRSNRKIHVCPSEHSIEPVYDGDEKSSWSECAWKPKELVKEK